MAALQRRNNSWRVIFWYKGRQHAFTVGEVSAADAAVQKASTEELLRLLKRNLITIPSGCDIERFMFHRGKPPESEQAAPPSQQEWTLVQLRAEYFRSQEKKLEQTTLNGIRLHFDHLERILGANCLISALTRGDLQRYVDKRSEEWIDPARYRKKRRERDAAKPPRKNRKAPPPKEADKPRRHPSPATINKEIVTLRTAWNWARRHQMVTEEFPGTGLDYAKTEESLPFMTWEEAERRTRADDDPDKVWDCVYLRPGEIAELIEYVKGRPISPWVYPMFAFAAYTGARRSEIVRVLPSDVDLTCGVVTIREKKRDKRKLTTRRVPLTPFLKDILSDWSKERAYGKTLFCKGDGAEVSPREAHNYFQRALRTSKWHVLKGWHVFRHSFISALANKGVDQRVIDELVGHSTEQQRRRYRHLYPDVKEKALADVFGRPN